MAKIVYNACFGGFSLSRKAILLARKLSNNPTWGGASIVGDSYEDGSGKVTSDYGGAREISRCDPVLIQVVEALGDEANGAHARLRIEEIPPGGKYRIDEYDGNESVETPDSYEWQIAP